MRRLFASLCLVFLAAACTPMATGPVAPPQGAGPVGPRPSAREAADNFAFVTRRVEPVAERICRARAPRTNCDFNILVDRRAALPPNAFQTLDDNGRPLIVFTLALVADVRNRDELAFVMAHEAAHHIAGHIPRTQANAVRGALLVGALAALQGMDAGGIRQAQNLGAAVGARAYSKEFELEADEMGTLIAWRAGFDPARGARYFERLPDPGNRFLGTHPPNAARAEAVAETVRTLGPR